MSPVPFNPIFLKSNIGQIQNVLLITLLGRSSYAEWRKNHFAPDV